MHGSMSIKFTLTIFCSICVYICIYRHSRVIIWLLHFLCIVLTLTYLFLFVIYLYLVFCWDALYLTSSRAVILCVCVCVCVCVCFADVSATTIYKLQCARRIDQEHSLCLVNVCSRSHCFCILEEWGHFRNKILAFRGLYN
jgi:hypothetical protein